MNIYSVYPKLLFLHMYNMNVRQFYVLLGIGHDSI